MRVSVGGLPPAASKDDGVRVFRQFGADDGGFVLPLDRRAGRQRGVAAVEITDPVRARAALVLFAKRPRRLSALLLSLLAAGAATGAPARAGGVSADVGLTLNPIIGGIHESFNDRVHVPPVPIPLIEARIRYRLLELDLSGLPPVASIPYDDALQGHTSTRLSIFEGIARVWDPLHRFSAGIGQTLYNQGTHYADAIEIGGTGETQFSRVAGITYQAGYAVPFRGGRFEAVFNYAPVMLGTQYTIYDIGMFPGRADPERAEQIDTAIRFVHPAGRRADVLFGLRYVNYTARYAVVGGGLSDRNVGLLAVFGYRTRIGP